MDPEEAEAREQQLIEEAFVYHTEKQYPAGVTDNRKRVIRKKAAKFEVQDGVLFYKMKKKDEVGVCDERKMRAHLSQCFEHKQLSAFPTTKAAPRPKLRHITIPVYCPCLRPDSFDQMIQCDRCDVWHHYKCVNIKEAPRGDWFCPACS